MKRSNAFALFANRSSHAVGHPIAFAAALVIVAAWALTGPLFQFSDTWQLIINTSTTIVTFLMVFLIQNTQNRDNHALQLKIDELIRATRGAHNVVLNLEELSDRELDLIQKKYAKLADEARDQMLHGGRDTGSPSIKPR